MKLNISLIQGIYLCYMFNFFKTALQINHPYELKITRLHQFIKHPINFNTYENKICPLGNIVGFILPIWFIARHYIKGLNILLINKLIMNSTLIVSGLLNLNAFVYFFPVYILDKYAFPIAINR